ncbi:MAG: YebC/PmpR family DNA-binding transcriptional regulator [Bacilli bacterium]|nr:YebC/PmpR family DNA-binding transcriptional regulator [Bacilli bacterium]
MGRAYEVRKASIQKTGAAKAKLYSTFAKEIYLAAKKGVPEIESNISLKRLVEKAKKQQVPSDIINRAIDKAKGAGQDEYTKVVYEGFGPGASTLIIETLTDNVNRTVGFVRAAFNKVHKSLGVSNSVSYNYDYLGVVSFAYANEEEIFNAVLEAGIEPVDFESEDGEITISVRPTDHNKIKDAIETIIPNVDYTFDEVGMFAKEKITLEGDDLEIFNRLLGLLEDIEDVSNIYHNVNL